MAFGPMCELYMPPEMELKAGNGYVKPDPSTLRVVPWLGGGKYSVGEVLCELLWRDHTPQDVCPRYVARQQLNIMGKELGWKITSAFEAEFYLRHNKSDSPVFTNDQLDTTLAMAPVSTLLMNVAAEARNMGVNMEKYNTEFGESQFEFNLGPTCGLASPDGMFTFKEVLKELCLQSDITATFMSLPYTTSPTNGLHFNHSIWDASGRNVFFDASDPDNLSSFIKHWTAGLIEHSAALTAITCPTVNCYRRLHTFVTPHVAQWGLDVRWSCFRLKNDDEKHTYVESRLASGAANPYLLVAAHIAAGLDGVRRKLPLPPAMHEEAAELPHSLEEALEALKNDQLMCEQLGQRLVQWFIDSKTKLEIEAFKHHNMKVSDPDQIAKEREKYLVI